MSLAPEEGAQVSGFSTEAARDSGAAAEGAAEALGRGEPGEARSAPWRGRACRVALRFQGCFQPEGASLVLLCSDTREEMRRLPGAVPDCRGLAPAPSEAGSREVGAWRWVSVRVPGTKAARRRARTPVRA